MSKTKEDLFQKQYEWEANSDYEYFKHQQQRIEYGWEDLKKRVEYFNKQIKKEDELS